MCLYALRIELRCHAMFYLDLSFREVIVIYLFIYLFIYLLLLLLLLLLLFFSI